MSLWVLVASLRGTRRASGSELVIADVDMKYTLAFILGSLLVACVPVQQCDVSGGHKYDSFGYYGDYGLLSIGPTNQKKTIRLLPGSSYALSANGTKYGIRTEPHFFDRERKVSYVRDHITLVDQRGKRIGRIPQNGIWQFHFEFIGPNGKSSRDFTSRFSTFFYNPLLHGPPN